MSNSLKHFFRSLLQAPATYRTIVWVALFVAGYTFRMAYEQLIR